MNDVATNFRPAVGALRRGRADDRILHTDRILNHKTLFLAKIYTRIVDFIIFLSLRKVYM